MRGWQDLADGSARSRIRMRAGRLLEPLRYAFRRPRERHAFWIVSCAWNAGDDALRCLDSVHVQDHDRDRITHLFIDDGSTDGTDARVNAWLEAHPGHRVRYIRNAGRVGGTANTLKGFRAAPAGSIVIELNGDDWLPDRGVLSFLDRVYADDDVWMTYNSARSAADGRRGSGRPVPRRIVRANAFRAYGWVTHHLHTFRRELFAHVRDEDLIDPVTGTYWASADDQAIYLAMLELAGTHSRHIHRITCVYNPRAAGDPARDRAASRDRAARIRQARKYEPLQSLTG